MSGEEIVGGTETVTVLVGGESKRVCSPAEVATKLVQTASIKVNELKIKFRLTHFGC